MDTLTYEHVSMLNNVNEKWDFLYSEVERKLDVLCPVRDFSFKKDKPPWLTPDLIELMKDKDGLLKRARKTKKETDKLQARQARNLVNALVKRARSDFVKDQLEINRADPKKFWDTIKHVFGGDMKNNTLHLLDNLKNPIPEKETAEPFLPRLGET